MKSIFFENQIIKKKREQNFKISKYNFNNENFKYLKTRHSFHLVDPSPWPLVAGLGAFCMTSGGVCYMHNFIGGGQLCLIGLFIILYVMYMWWRDIIREATFDLKAIGQALTQGSLSTSIWNLISRLFIIIICLI